MFEKLKRSSKARLVRSPAVAGRFYPADAGSLRAMVGDLVSASGLPSGNPPKALIVPHAGYRASGPVAGFAYASLAGGRQSIRRVILLGPSHYVNFSGLAACAAGTFETPLGPVAVDAEACDSILTLPAVCVLDAAHHDEHSLEVQLPFLQVVLQDFSLVPLVVGNATPRQVAEVLNHLWGGAETCIIVSSDLSHYLEYAKAQESDCATARIIESMDWESLKSDQACGCHPIRGLLLAATEHGLRCRTLDLRNSGDTIGMRERVVGYGAFAFS